jgi:hypothetical protein
VRELQASYPAAEIQLWCSDEHRLGLKPILRRVYVPEGETPIASVNWRFQWLWLYAFVHPQSGESYYWILPYVIQPAERLWTLVDEPIANRSFETLDDLEDVLFKRCQSLMQQQDLIRGLTGFHWWIQIGV